MEFKLSEILAQRLRSKNLDESVFRANLWNSIIDKFLEKNGIDITSHMVSISVSGESIFIKTQKPIINAELLALEKEIMQDFYEKMNRIGFKFKEFKIKYL